MDEVRTTAPEWKPLQDVILDLMTPDAIRMVTEAGLDEKIMFIKASKYIIAIPIDLLAMVLTEIVNSLETVKVE